MAYVAAVVDRLTGNIVSRHRTYLAADRAACKLGDRYGICGSADAKSNVGGGKEYTDGTTATGIAPLPELSPRQHDTKTALRLLTDIESMNGRSGATISLRGLIERLGA